MTIFKDDNLQQTPNRHNYANLTAILNFVQPTDTVNVAIVNATFIKSNQLFQEKTTCIIRSIFK